MKNKSYTPFFLFLRFIGITGLAFILGCKSKVETRDSKVAQSVDYPNIVLIMADDMGFSDLGTYGGEIDTPNLDRLANNGIRFSQFYNTARCCPTRASLMTGLYPQQTGIGHMTQVPKIPGSHDLKLPGYRGILNEKNITIPEMLKASGYKTYMTGKWHLGFEDREQWPIQRGFDKFYGLLSGASNYFKPEYPRGISVGNDTISINDENYYTTDAFTENAIKFISEEKFEDAPFFLYLAYTAPHWPLHAKKEDIDKYRDRYKEGWQALREARFRKLQEIGMLDPEWELSPQDSKEWEKLPEEKKEEMSLRMAIYAAQIDRMDQNIGRLINYLEDEGELDNTMIVFLSDNGACAEGGALGGGPASQLETEEGFLLSYGRNWANASNTPFRKYKHWIHEGGIATPLIIHWPKKISKRDQGKIINHYGFLPDIMATIKDVTNSTYPKEKNGLKIPPLEGKSFLSLITGNDKVLHEEPIFWEHEGNKAVRLGKYKLVMEWKNKDSNEWELYDLDKDRTELNNLASQMPQKVMEMADMWENWAKDKQVEPWDKIQELMN